jgi:hypothetical protein
VTARIAFAAVLLTGCAGLLGPAGHPARAQLECRAEVLAPYLGDAAEAAAVQAAVQIQGGSISPVQLLLSLGLSPKEVLDVAKRYQACGGAAPEAEVLVTGGTAT